MRDWSQVTRDYLDFAFDFDKKGEHLPLIRWTDDSREMIWMPAYIGGKSGDSFWYGVLPNVLYFQIGALYPGDPRRDERVNAIAAKLYDGCVALGGRVDPPALPNFDHTGFDLRTMQPFDNAIRIEPEGAAGIAWIEYAAWLKSKDARFLTAADWAVRALEKKPAEANPLYEVLLPYAALTAARMNAELKRDYDLSKLLNWCFEPRPKPQARPNWGVIRGNWNGMDVSGLVGSDTDGGSSLAGKVITGNSVVPIHPASSIIRIQTTDPSRSMRGRPLWIFTPPLSTVSWPAPWRGKH